MSKKKPKTDLTDKSHVDEGSLFARVAEIIETRKTRAGAYANREVTLMYWEIGRYINSVVLDGERAAYGKKIFATLGRKLVERYGRSFEEKNLYRMAQFATVYADVEILAPLAQQLSWSHFRELIRIKDENARDFYANDASERHLGVRELYSVNPR